MNKHLLLLYLVFISVLDINADIAIQTQEERHAFLIQAKALEKSDEDSALVFYKSLIDSAELLQDSITMVCSIRIGKIQGRKQNFADAFDYSIQALAIAEAIKDSLSMATIKADLGILYQEFGKENISREYLIHSLELVKHLYKQNKISQQRLSGAHFTLATHYRKFAHYDLALNHLDTNEVISEIMNRPKVFDSYHRSEQAFIYTQIGRTDTAKMILHDVERLILDEMLDDKVYEGLKGFISVVYYYLGNAYLKENKFEPAISYYQKALHYNEKYGYHNSLRTDILEREALAQFNSLQFKQAYLSLRQSKELGDAYFGATSVRNNSLIEIKNKYKEEVVQQRIALLEQEKLLSDQRQSIFIFRIILIVLIGTLVIFFLLYQIKKQRTKFGLEKELIQEKQEKAKEALDIKNKELTAFTLKLIEKEETIHTLAEKLRETSKGDQSTETILKTLNAETVGLWNEFNSRFIAVNSGFYEHLQKKYPELSPTERKHCALIKLNFSGKEMASLLGISVTSVHVSRYRLRKRFGLDKNENLTDFIAKI
ncbi:tetratricopeptide repeat protein [Labilibacter marinus]|uniref:tetratricopeptide repeat protein n=1 Tax=Labilibacter marinus TaxID=1477105 RepID=UPI0008300691|nr:tetratricopeptide repeat protein [Labilibacter marinus]